MSTTTMTRREAAAAKWATVKPIAIALGIGLLAGPVISSFAGFQVRTSTAQAATQASVVEQQASFCAVRALAEVPEPARLDWSARNDLARRWAVMPGSTAADPDVTYACSRKLTG